MDAKFLKKKRHIGNDHVHIVWNDHDRNYQRIIGGDFGNAQIIITPLKKENSEFFSVKVCRDPKIPIFGPLVNNCIIPKKELGPLVRLTAVNAHRAAIGAQSQQLGSVISNHPYHNRLADILVNYL
jgi:hypothetical protein